MPYKTHCVRHRLYPVFSTNEKLSGWHQIKGNTQLCNIFQNRLKWSYFNALKYHRNSMDCSLLLFCIKAYVNTCSTTGLHNTFTSSRTSIFVNIITLLLQLRRKYCTGRNIFYCYWTIQSRHLTLEMSFLPKHYTSNLHTALLPSPYFSNALTFNEI